MFEQNTAPLWWFIGWLCGIGTAAFHFHLKNLKDGEDGGIDD